ncbi:MAG: putative rane protein [Nevskia sp.]|nr:putative rane protein [Nevskia sp.]
MSTLWPWLAVAGVGALHGLNPATGWMFAAAWGVQSRDRAQALRALAPIAAGHAASVALVAAAVVLGLAMDRVVLQTQAGVLLAAIVAYHLAGRKTKRARAPAGHAGLALWSFIMSTAHGAGLMLVPAFIPLCMGDASAREITASGSLMMALAAVGVHTAAMLVVTGVIACGVCRGFDAGGRLLQGLRMKRPPATRCK